MSQEIQQIAHLLESHSNALLLIAESPKLILPANFTGKIISNRFQTVQQLSAQNANCVFSDFVINKDDIEKDIIFRTFKEKAISLYIIETYLKQSSCNTSLTILGYKNEGISSLIKRIETFSGLSIEQEKHKQLVVVSIKKSRHLHNKVQKHNYQSIIRVDHDISYFSKPGVFGWNKIDKGSRLLIEHFKQQQHASHSSILDLGCGYGYLSIEAWKMGFSKIDATDNNAAAISACKYNFYHQRINGKVFASNCADTTEDYYDIILCNPPFHQGFDHTKSLTGQFVRQAYNRLKTGGCAYFVVNQFIAIEKAAENYFTSQQNLATNDGFKILKLEKK